MGRSGAAVLLVGVGPETEEKLTKSARGLSFTRGERDATATSAAAALVSLEKAPELEASYELIAKLARQGTPVVALGPTKDADLILRAMRAGAQEYVVAGDERELVRALRSRTRTEAANEGRIVTIFPARGGIGATAVAANLAGMLARKNERACLVDFDLAFGDALAHLDLAPTYALADVLANMPRLDRELLDASVVRHASGLFVMGRGERIEETAPVRARDLAPLPAFLRQHYRHVVVDGVRGFDELSLAALDASDEILLLVVQDVPAVRNAQRALELFKRLGYDLGKIALVVNRFQRHAKITPAVLAETTGLPVRATLANDFAALSQAIDRGVLLGDIAPRSALTRDIAALATTLQGPTEAPRPRSLFARLFSKG